MIEFVTCTQRSLEGFWRESALGLSLARFANDTRCSVSVAAQNQVGLSQRYNQRITALDSHDFLVFVHDDVWLEDYFVLDRILDGLAHFDVIGVAGNLRRLTNQPSWAFASIQPTGEFIWDDASQLSGAVGHGPNPLGSVSWFGPVPAACELLDGVLLAVRKEMLIATGVRFDEQFEFHFYDMDFCRSARHAGLRLGTWSIALTHQSAGNFGTPLWREQYRKYLAKWGQ